MLMRAKGEHRGIYNIGRPEETKIADLARLVAAAFRISVDVVSGGGLREGDAVKRRPDISKLAALGYAPKIGLAEGLRGMIGGAA